MKHPLIVLFTLILSSFIVSCSAGGTVTAVASLHATETPQVGASLTYSPTPFLIPMAPLGIAVLQNDDSILAFYDLEGSPLGAFSLPLEGRRLQSIHLSGSASSGLKSLAMMQIQQGDNQIIIMNGDEELLRVDGSLITYSAIPGQPVIAFGSAQTVEDGRHLISQFYLGTPDTLAGSEPVFSVTGDYGGAWGPLRIQVEENHPVGIWYSQWPYALGGEMFFDLTNGLYFLDLETGLSTEFTIQGETIFQPVFSPDGTWLSYVRSGEMRFYNMQDGDIYSIAQLPECEWGGGNVTIAPDDLHVAWREIHGTHLGDPPDYYAVLRVGTITSGLLHDFGVSFFEQAAGFKVWDVSPVTWLDGHTLLFSLISESGTRQVWTLDLTGLQTLLLASGDFAGLMYP